MKKYIVIPLVLVAVTAGTVYAKPKDADPFEALWAAVAYLQEQIAEAEEQIPKPFPGIHAGQEELGTPIGQAPTDMEQGLINAFNGDLIGSYGNKLRQIHVFIGEFQNPVGKRGRKKHGLPFFISR